MANLIQGSEIVLEGVVDIDHLPWLRAELEKLIAGTARSVVINLDRVEDVDVAILQLIYSAWLTLRTAGRQLQLRKVSPGVWNRATQLGGFPPMFD